MRRRRRRRRRADAARPATWIVMLADTEPRCRHGRQATWPVRCRPPIRSSTSSTKATTIFVFSSGLAAPERRRSRYRCNAAALWFRRLTAKCPRSPRRAKVLFPHRLLRNVNLPRPPCDPENFHFRCGPVAHRRDSSPRDSASCVFTTTGGRDSEAASLTTDTDRRCSSAVCDFPRTQHNSTDAATTGVRVNSVSPSYPLPPLLSQCTFVTGDDCPALAFLPAPPNPQKKAPWCCVFSGLFPLSLSRFPPAPLSWARQACACTRAPQHRLALACVVLFSRVPRVFLPCSSQSALCSHPPCGPRHQSSQKNTTEKVFFVHHFHQMCTFCFCASLSVRNTA